MAVTINKKTMAMIIFAAFIFLALTSAAVQAEKIAFVRENNIWVANLNGGTQKQLTFSGKMKDPANFFPILALSPDGLTTNMRCRGLGSSKSKSLMFMNYAG